MMDIADVSHLRALEDVGSQTIMTKLELNAKYGIAHNGTGYNDFEEYIEECVKLLKDHSDRPYIDTDDLEQLKEKTK